MRGPLGVSAWLLTVAASSALLLVPNRIIFLEVRGQTGAKSTLPTLYKCEDLDQSLMDKANIVCYPGTDKTLTVRILSFFNFFFSYFLKIEAR